MKNGLVNALKSINTTVYHSKIEIQRLNYVHNFLLILEDIDHRINQLQNGLEELEEDVATIYSYISTLGSKTVTPMLISPVDLKTILNNNQALILSYLSIPNDPNTNIWSCEFLEIHPLIYNESLIISLIVPLVDSTFHLQLYHMHTILMVNKVLCKTFKIGLKILIWL